MGKAEGEYKCVLALTLNHCLQPAAYRSQTVGLSLRTLRRYVESRAFVAVAVRREHKLILL
jgi:hypothetical protein